MNTSAMYEKAGSYCDCAAEKFADVQVAAKAGYDFAHSQLSALLEKFVVSEVCVLKFMLISFGVLLGTVFSDFFKKHRKFVVIACIASVALFVYKTFQLMEDWEETTEEF